MRHVAPSQTTIQKHPCPPERPSPDTSARGQREVLQAVRQFFHPMSPIPDGGLVGRNVTTESSPVASNREGSSQGPDNVNLLPTTQEAALEIEQVSETREERGNNRNIEVPSTNTQQPTEQPNVGGHLEESETI